MLLVLLADQVPHDLGHGAREQGHQDRVHREAANGLAHVELLVLLLERYDRHAAHNQRSQWK